MANPDPSSGSDPKRELYRWVLTRVRMGDTFQPASLIPGGQGQPWQSPRGEAGQEALPDHSPTTLRLPRSPKDKLVNENRSYLSLTDEARRRFPRTLVNAFTKRGKLMTEDFLAILVVAVARNELSLREALGLVCDVAPARVADDLSSLRLGYDITRRFLSADGELKPSLTAAQRQSAFIFSYLLDVHAEALFSLDKYFEAAPLFQAISRVYEACDLTIEAADARANYALAVGRGGSGDVAVRELDRAEEAFSSIGSAAGVARCRLARAEARSVLGEYEEALFDCDQAEAAFAAIGQQKDVARCHLRRGVIYGLLNKSDESFIEINRGISLYRALGCEAEARRCISALADLLRTAEDSAVEQSLTRYPNPEDIGGSLSVAQSLLDRAFSRSLHGQHKEALVDCDAAESSLRRHGQWSDVARCHQARALALQGLGNLHEAIACHDDTYTLFLPDDLLWTYHLDFGQLYWSAGRRTDALDQFKKGRAALRRARRTARIDETSLEYIARRQELTSIVIRCNLEMNHPRSAFGSLQDGKASLLRDFLTSPGQASIAESQDLHESRTRLCRWLQHERDQIEDEVQRRLLAAAKTSSEEVLAMRETIEREIGEFFAQQTAAYARTYLAKWRLARFGPAKPAESAPGHLGSPSSPMDDDEEIKQIQSSLPAEWALLDYFVVDDQQIKVFALTCDQLKVHTLNVPFRSQELQQAFLDLKVWTSHGHLIGDEGLGLFYDRLFEPLESFLRSNQIKGLYLVPHGRLHRVPLHACPDKEGRPLGGLEVAYLPSAALLAWLPRLAALDGSMLSLANPERQTNWTLPCAEWEAQRVHKALDSPNHRHRLWTGLEAGLDKTLAWEKVSLLHFSGHGFGHQSFSPISYLRMADGLLLAHDIVHDPRRSLAKGALVILNGCETAVRDWRAVDEGFGLMTAFLLRGAGLVLATQWKVSDLCAAEMSTAFLTALLERGATPAAALKNAQEHVRSLSAEWVEETCRRLQQELFRKADFPIEHAKLGEEAMKSCLRGGNHSGARYYAEQAVATWRSVGRKEQANLIGAKLALGEKIESKSRNMHSPAFDHPVYWAAFQLIGRIA